MEEPLEAKYARDLNCLRDKDKNVRIGGLKRIAGALAAESKEGIEQLFAIRLKYLLMELLKDPADKCKELAISVLLDLTKTQKIPADDVAGLVNAVHSRLAPEPCPEACEEVRILLTQLLLEVLKNYTNCIQPVISDVTDILSKLAKDRCPSIKTLTSTAVVFISTHALRFACKKLVESLKGNLSHQQFKVRSSTLEALGALCLTEPGVAEELYFEFKKTQIDRRVEVRSMTYSMVTEVLLNANYVEMRKIEGNFVYLLLGGLSDEECAASVYEKVKNVAQRVMKSAEEFGEENLGSDEGCLAIRNLKVIIELALADIMEWTIQDLYRSRAVSNLKYTVLMAKVAVVPFLDKIFKAVFRAYSNADDSKYAETLENVAKSAASVLPFDSILEAYDKILSEPLSASEKSSGLSLLGKLSELLPKAPELLASLLDFISNKNFLQDPPMFASLSTCLLSIIQNFSNLCLPHVHQLFFSLLSIESSLHGATQATIQLLSEVCGYSSVSELYSLQIPESLPKIIKNHQNWDSGSSERSQFRSLVCRAGSGVKRYWNDIIDVIIENCVREKESEVRYDMLVAFESVIHNPELKECVLRSSKRVLFDVIAPTAAWKVGASSVQIRISSLLCLRKVMEERSVEPEALTAAWEPVFSAVKGCLDDDWDSELRLCSVNCLMPLLENYNNRLSGGNILECLNELMKRLDDPVDLIRVLVTRPIKLCFSALQSLDEDYEGFPKAVRVLFLHLDDDNEELRNGVTAVIVEAAMWRREEVIKIANEKKEKQRNQSLIDEILQII